MTHICVGKLTNIDSDNGLLPERRQAIIWTNVGILLIGPLGTNFSEFLIGIHRFSFKKMHLKMSSAKWRPFCLGLNVLIYVTFKWILIFEPMLAKLHCISRPQWLKHFSKLNCSYLIDLMLIEGRWIFLRFFFLFHHGLNFNLLLMLLSQFNSHPYIDNTAHVWISYIVGLVQERCNWSALAMELHLCWTNPPIWW